MALPDYIATVRRAKRGDTGAFSELVVAFQDLAVGTAFGWLGDVELARDASQEAFLDAYLRLGQLQEPTAFPAWFRTIVLKHSDRLTRRGRPAAAPLELGLDVAAPDAAPDAHLVCAQEAERLRLAVESLPAPERMVIALHYFAEVSGPDLARFLDLPLSTVKKRLRTARARLREEGDHLMEHTIDHARPSRTREFADEVAFFIAIRAGDRVRVEEMLKRSPGLIEARQEWEPTLVFEGVLPFASRATALITTIERDDLAMLTLLLDSGADVDGTCGCVTGEPPLWAATTLNRIDHVSVLLERGADTNVYAATGNTPLHVAAMRGFADIAQALLAKGADPDAVDSNQRRPVDWALLSGHDAIAKLLERRSAGTIEQPCRDVEHTPGHGAHESILHTGIKALDLFAPVPRGGLVRFPFKAGVGMVVLLGELCRRITMRHDGRALWTGFAQRPFDVGDWAGEIAELGLAGRLHHSLAGFDEPAETRRNAFLRGLDGAETLCAAGHDVLLVLLSEAGFEADIEASLARLSMPHSPARLTPPQQREARITTIVVTPFPERPGAFAALDAPFDAQITLDRRRAKRGLYPAIDPVSTLSDALTAELVGERHYDLARRSRELLEAHAQLDAELAFAGTDDASLRTASLFRYLAQPFFVTEPFTGRPGELVERAAMLDAVESILQAAPD